MGEEAEDEAMPNIMTEAQEKAKEDNESRTEKVETKVKESDIKETYSEAESKDTAEEEVEKKAETKETGANVLTEDKLELAGDKDKNKDMEQSIVVSKKGELKEKDNIMQEETSDGEADDKDDKSSSSSSS